MGRRIGMIKLFEEYTEFRKTGDVFNFADHIITKNNWEDFILKLNEFLVIGEWYRIRFTPHINLVIRLSGLHSGSLDPEIKRYFQRNFTITWDREYFKGEVTDPSPHHKSMVGNGHVWFSIKNNDVKSMFRDDLFKTKPDERIYYYNWESNKNTIIEHLERKNIVKNLSVDPLGEEDWDDLKESKKRKKTICRGKLMRPDIDPLGEEDWGWDIDNQIDDSLFKGNLLVYKKNRFDRDEYYVSVLNSHHEILIGIGLAQSLSLIKKHNKLTPLTEREIERIKKDKIQLIPNLPNRYNFPSNDFGNPRRIPYSDFKKKAYFLDQDYMDRYLYLNENKINEYVEFRKTETFNDYCATAACGRHFVDFLLHGSKWHRFKFGDYKSQVIKVFKAAEDYGWLHVSYTEEYINGEIVKYDEPKYIGLIDNDLYKKVKVEKLKNVRDYRAPDPMIDPLGEEDWEDE
jgi:hypothetical protein